MKPRARPSLVVLLFAAILPVAPAQTIITPTSATASSEYNTNYLIDYAIDGSGLPPSFTLADTHAAYSGANHWTTASGPASEAFAIFAFSTPQTLTHFFLWNHLANTAPHSNNYYVTQFDLTFRDADNNVLWTESNLTATFLASAQTYLFPAVSNVSSVLFEVDTHAGNPDYTGVAEVRFGYQVIPEPGTVALLLGGVGLLAALLRRRHESPQTGARTGSCSI